VFVHGSGGSVEGWRELPRRLCERSGLRGLLYSRQGHGRSSPPPAPWPRPSLALRHEARVALPALLQSLQVPVPYALVGHGDGALVALLHAATFPDRAAGLAALAPGPTWDGNAPQQLRAALRCPQLALGVGGERLQAQEALEACSRFLLRLV